MQIIFENHDYDSKQLESMFSKSMIEYDISNNKGRISYVGYLYSKKLKEMVFVLPKVFVNEEGLVFDHLTPEKILSVDSLKDIHNECFVNRLYTLSMWIYQSIFIYQSKVIDKNSDIVINLNKKSSDKYAHTIMELYFAFINFYKKNKNIFVRKKINSFCGKKINWIKTVIKEKPIIQDDSICYVRNRTVKSKVNYEEELVCLYLSVLNYFNKTYNFNFTFDDRYKILNFSQIQNYIGGKGILLLRRLKGQYFSDVFLELWKLLYNFFDLFSKISTSSEYSEGLITNNYPMVFESMIDSLIGDRDSKIPKYFKDQKDGKIVDHLYLDNDLFSNEKIYFIGDSKYYKSGTYARGESVAKQFTYAKNVIQYNVNPYRVTSHAARYRDEVTEGYNISPNFFISAMVSSDYDASSDRIEYLDAPEFQCQFINRLFDRDTLTVLRYSVNFLYVLSVYISKNDSEKQTFRKKIREKFRNDVIRYFSESYMFLKINCQDKINDVIKPDFYKLNGRIYSFKDQNFFIYAVDKKHYLDDSDSELSLPDFIAQKKQFLSGLKGVTSVEDYSLV